MDEWIRLGRFAEGIINEADKRQKNSIKTAR
jgi:hypothetical protein